MPRFFGQHGVVPYGYFFLLKLTQCEKRYASYVNKQCSGAKASNQEYYNSLKKSCKSL
jgi:hypothetical protein